MDKEVLELIIRDTLEGVGLCSEDAVQLLLGTCAQESAMGRYRRQIGGGPALGIMQMEPGTYRDIVGNYLRFKPALREKVLRVSQLRAFGDAEDLVRNDRLAICMARVHYLRVREAIPSDLEGWARYWKRWYNTPKGRGTEEEFVENYRRYVAAGC